MKNIIITGSGRSGTSMLAGILGDNGYYIGTDYIRSRDSNPKGFFEGREINRLNEMILERVVETRSSFIGHLLKVAPFLERNAKSDRPIKGRGQLWLARVPLDADIGGSSAIDGHLRRLTSRAPFCFKDPRFCYTLPVWRPFLDNDNTAYLCVFRHPADTIRSILKECRREKYLRGLKMDFRKSCEVWKLMYRHILEKHRFVGNWLFLHYEQLFDSRRLALLENVTGATVNPGFPDRKLQRSHGGYELDGEIVEIYGQLRRLADYDER